MFEALTEKLEAVFRRLVGKGRLTEKDVDEALREVRLALLEADVNFQVVKALLGRVRERAVGEEVLQSISPGQQVVKIVHEELQAILKAGTLSRSSQPPTVVLLVGLQGSGKTTTAAKLGRYLKNQGQLPLLVAADVKRPAAQEQLAILGKQLSLPVYSEGKGNVATLCSQALDRAKQTGASWLLVDTAGRLHIDEEMMAELVELKKILQPSEVLLVVDAMTGQDAVRVAEEFQARVSPTGLILTKLDGDARGGAALSITFATGVPIKFLGVGEKLDALEPFHPDRLASRILGMGDVLTLVEKAQATWDQAQTAKLEEKLRKATFNLEDFLEQLRQVKKIGSLSQILELIPGLSRLGSQLPTVEEKELKKMEAIILSMTPEERQEPEIVEASRRRRIARGSGTAPADVNRLLKQFFEARRLMKQLSKGKLKAFPFPFR